MIGQVYIYKGKFYQIEADLIQIKCPKTGAWHKGVVYRQYITGFLFARDYDDFKAKFELVKE